MPITGLDKAAWQMKSMGTWLIVAGAVMIVAGLLFKSGMLSWFGRLPGDIRYEGENVRFYFPVVTMIVISFVFSLILFIARKF